MKLGYNASTSEWCAVKILKDASSKEKLAMFVSEVRLMATCHHESIIDLKHCSVAGTLIKPSGESRLIVYHITSYARYGELYDLLAKTGAFSERLARTFFLKLLKGTESS